MTEITSSLPCAIQVPEGWRSMRMGYLFSHIDERSKTGNERLLSITKANGVVPRDSITDKPARAESLIGYKLCQSNDLVVNQMSVYDGLLGVSPIDGLITYHYLVFRPHQDVDPRFYSYLLRTELYKGDFSQRVRGLGDFAQANVRTPHIRISDFLQTVVPVPPLQEQRRIADFLDDQIGRINSIRGCRQRQLVNIHERFQMEIDFHLSSANNKNEAFVAARHVVKVLPGYAFSSENYVNDESQIKLLRGINLGIRQLNWLDVAYWRRDQAKGLQEYLLRPGDLVLGMDRPWISGGMRIAIVQESDIPSLLLQRVAKLIPSPDMTTEYVYWAYQSSDFRQWIESDLSGVSVPHLSAEQILGYRIPKRPIHDQAVVARQLADSLEQIKKIMYDIRTGIQLLEERKQSLITGAVTGQLNVSAVKSIEVAL